MNNNKKRVRKDFFFYGKKKEFYASTISTNIVAEKLDSCINDIVKTS